MSPMSHRRLKILLSLSLVFNMTFVSFGAYTIEKRGGGSYIKARFLYDRHIAFVGDSLTEQHYWLDREGYRVLNFGVGGNTTTKILARLDEVAKRHPQKVFLMAGINDRLSGESVDSTALRYAEIVRRLHSATPQSYIYLESVLPVTDQSITVNPHIRGQADVMNSWTRELNKRIAALADNDHIVFVDMYGDFLLAGQLDPTYTLDGIHLGPAGYAQWEKHVSAYLD
jgi:lysophospholipase L1-like esterase